MSNEIGRQGPTVGDLRDPEYLRRKYVDEKMTGIEIADEIGCSHGTVYNWLQRHGIKRRDKGDYAASRPATYFTNASVGYYPGWSNSKHNEFVPVHRLLAVSEYGFEAVKGKYIHHKNGIPWDNRPDNIEPLNPSEHTSMHTKEMHEKGMFKDGSLNRPKGADGRFVKSGGSDA